MKIINPSVSIIKEENPLKKIELAGRTCYKSESKITETSSKKFVEMIIKRGHESVLEHVRFAFKVSYRVYAHFQDNKHIVRSGSENNWNISANVRAWRDYFKESFDSCGILQLLKQIAPVFFEDIDSYSGSIEKGISYLTSNIHKENKTLLIHTPLTVRFVCDRGVSHELVRHRVASFSQESTRYVNYAGNGSMEFIKPCFDWASDAPIGIINLGLSSKGYDTVKSETRMWLSAIEDAEEYYNRLIEFGCSPQEARSVLPNSLKTEVVMTATYKEWEGILKLRLAKAAHPQMREVMQMLVTLPDFPKEIEYSLGINHGYMWTKMRTI